MRILLKSLLALLVAGVLTVAFRFLVISIYLVDGNGLEPEFQEGDRVLVNRWSYGLRTGGLGLFQYGRLCRQTVSRGDIVAYENPLSGRHGEVLFGSVCALPGDTVRYRGRTLLIPSLAGCADADYYWIKALNDHNPVDSRQLGFVSEQFIIGRVFCVAYSLDPDQPFFSSLRRNRLFVNK